MSLLLDTHTFLWYALDDTRLAAAARLAIDTDPETVFISPASYWEIAIKIGYGRYTLTMPFDELWGRAITQEQFTILPIEIRHATRLITLPLLHRDPFDRMLVAQALSENCPLVSNDTRLDAYGIRRIW